MRVEHWHTRISKEIFQRGACRSWAPTTLLVDNSRKTECAVASRIKVRIRAIRTIACCTEFWIRAAMCAVALRAESVSTSCTIGQRVQQRIGAIEAVARNAECWIVAKASQVGPVNLHLRPSFAFVLAVVIKLGMLVMKSTYTIRSTSRGL
jgi:hypothetical protein